ncbi:MAG TPA: hypothetical protein VF796_28295 [Humisphaera sp.]
MTGTVKLIFDECLSQLMMADLRKFLERSGCELTLQAVVDYQRAGVLDRDWVPRVAAEGQWIVISTDKGRSGNEPFEERLPFLCRLHRVTHVLLSPKVHKLKGFAKGQAIVDVWPEFATVRDATPGTRFVIQFNHTRTRFLLINSDCRQADQAKRRRERARKSGETGVAPPSHIR